MSSLPKAGTNKVKFVFVRILSILHANASVSVFLSCYAFLTLYRLSYLFFTSRISLPLSMARYSDSGC